VTRKSQISKNLFLILLLLAVTPGTFGCELGCTLPCEDGEGDCSHQDSVSNLSDRGPMEPASRLDDLNGMGECCSSHTESLVMVEERGTLQSPPIYVVLPGASLGDYNPVSATTFHPESAGPYLRGDRYKFLVVLQL
jgi:hypothetical protein